MSLKKMGVQSQVVLMHVINPSPWEAEAEAEASLIYRVSGQPRLRVEALS